MQSCLLKKFLPFALMFLLGTALAIVPRFFGVRTGWQSYGVEFGLRRKGQHFRGHRNHWRNHWRMKREVEVQRRLENFDAHASTNILATETFPSDITAKGESWTPVAILDRPNPEYTESARVRGVGGVVRLSVTFGADGRVSDIKPVSTLPYGLTEEAVDAVRRIRFLPARRSGRAVSTVGTIDCLFHTMRTEHCLYEN